MFSAAGGLRATAEAESLDYRQLEQLFGEPVTTSATGSPQRASEVPANMEIVTAEDIRRSGAYDIPGVLKHVIGVDVMQWNNDNADVGIRGYNQVFSPRVLVLLDGRQVYADQYGYVPWSALPVELAAIRQIEVVRGPNAALFGFNAATGVINIVTYSPLYDDVNTASVTGGSQGTIQGSLVKTLKLGSRGGLRFSAGGQFDNDFRTPIPLSVGPLGRQPNDRFAFDIDGAFRLSDTVQIGLETSYAGAKTNVINPTYTLTVDRNYAGSVKGWLNADTVLGLLQGTVYHNWTSQHSVGNAPINFDNDVTVIQIQDVFRIGSDHTLRASLEYRHNTVNTSPFQGAEVYYDNYSAGGMWNWAILPNLSLTNAVRFENLHLHRSGALPAGYPFSNQDWQQTLSEINANSALVWRADDMNTFRLIAGRGVQLPGLANLGAFLLASPFVHATGNPNLEPTDIMSYEIDWDRTISQIDGQSRVAVFKERVDDLFSITGANFGGGPPPYSGFANANASIAWGIEISLTGKVAPEWRWGVNYRFESITDHLDPFARGGTAYLDFEHVTPAHVVKANVGWARGRWEIDSYLYLQSATRGLAGLPFGSGSFLVPVQAYAAFDGRIAYRLTDRTTFAISGQNLLQSPQQQTSGPKVERRVFGTLTVDF